MRTQLKNQKSRLGTLSVLIILFILFTSTAYIATAEIYMDGVIFEEFNTTSYQIDIQTNWNSATPQYMHRIELNNANFCQAGFVQFTARFEASTISVYTLSEPYAAYDGEVRIDGDAGSLVGTTNYVHVHKLGDYVYIIVDFESLDLTGYSGQHTLHIMDLKLDELKTYYAAYTGTPTGDTDMFLIYSADRAFGTYDGVNPGDTYYNYQIRHDFYTTIQLYQNSSTTYRLFFDRDNFESKINVSIYNGTAYELYYQDETYTSNDTSIFVPSFLVSEGDEFYVNCTNLFGDFYEAYLVPDIPPPPDDGILNVLSGIVKDAKTNSIIPSNPINLLSVTGYGGAYNTTSSGDGTYSISRIIDDIYTISANRTGYENYTFQKNITSDTLHNIYMVQNITLTANKSGVYGTVTNYYNATGVTDVWVQISNETWYQVTYTNTNGYYEFLNFAPGNYTIKATKNGYFPYEILLTFSEDELKYHPFEFVSEDVPVSPTVTPLPPTTNILTPFRSILQQLGISTEFGGALIALFIIVIIGAIFTRAGTIATIAGMFFGFVVTVFMGLLPSYLLSIVIIVVVLLILKFRGDF